jgi:hypothetical protein
MSPTQVVGPGVGYGAMMTYSPVVSSKYPYGLLIFAISKVNLLGGVMDGELEAYG